MCSATLSLGASIFCSFKNISVGFVTGPISSYRTGNRS
jgi:hypothetical protein